MIEVLLLSFSGAVAFIALGVVVFHLFYPVPYVPTRSRAVHTVIASLALHDGDILVDPGAGDARLLIAAKRAHPGIRAIGYEVMPLVWLLARCRIWWSGLDIDLRLGDARRQDCSGVTHIVVYLLPGLLKELAAKFDAELSDGARVVSYVFAIPGREPESIVETGGKKVWTYLWRNNMVM